MPGTPGATPNEVRLDISRHAAERMQARNISLPDHSSSVNLICVRDQQNNLESWLLPCPGGFLLGIIQGDRFIVKTALSREMHEQSQRRAKSRFLPIGRLMARVIG